MLRRTAQGKMVDINALMSKNEKVRAVGNMKVNARGDIIDNQGRIIKSVNERVNESYGKTVGNKSANVVKKSNPSRQVVSKNEVKQELETKNIPVPDLTLEEKELENSFEDDVEIEKIKQKELKNANK